MAAILDLVIKGLFIEIAKKVVVGVHWFTTQHFLTVQMAVGCLHVRFKRMVPQMCHTFSLMSLVTLMGHLILVDV